MRRAATSAAVVSDETRPREVVLLGQPNVGKSALFATLTRSFAAVSSKTGAARPPISKPVASPMCRRSVASSERPVTSITRTPCSMAACRLCLVRGWMASESSTSVPSRSSRMASWRLAIMAASYGVAPPEVACGHVV